MSKQKSTFRQTSWQQSLHEIMFEADTTAGKTFNIILLLSILFSSVIVILDSVESFHLRYAVFLDTAEWILTLLFTIEYIVRLIIIRKTFQYSVSFFGIIDLLAIVPTWLGFLFGGFQSLLIIRVLRLLRVFRIFKLASFLYEATVLTKAIQASFQKIVVFLLTVIVLVFIIGSLMYTIEGPQFGFTDIPTSIYWAIVTLTTVGYGDIAPHTGIGKFLASAVMLLGYGIIAVPTGIVTVELSNISRNSAISTQSCPSCGKDGHDHDARNCKFCGSAL